MKHTAALVSLATSVPPHVFHQKQILEAARDVVGDRYPQFETLSSLFANTGILHRYGVKPIEWYLEPRGWPERTQAFLEGAEHLFIDVANKAIARAVGVIFQRTIPDFVKENMGPAVTEILSRMELSLGDIDRFICHPGGAKVIAALERAFALHQGTLDHERGVIADYGNMSAPTVLFVLERALAQGLRAQPLRP